MLSTADAIGTLPALAQARRIRNTVVRALVEEVLAYPKPGLVSLVDSGSHHDMDATTFMHSALALRRYFEECALAGERLVTFDVLKRLGIAAEVRMMRATRGINTHRGAIFNLGLLAAAAGCRGAAGKGASLGDLVARHWGASIAAHRTDPCSHGSRMHATHGVGGAKAEAADGFPAVYGTALPAYREVLSRGGSSNQARVQAFFALMAQLEDTNLLHRGGVEGLAFARLQARRFLEHGGVFATGWLQHAIGIHHAFRARWLSPGGSADLLAACLFVHAVER